MVETYMWEHTRYSFNCSLPLLMSSESLTTNSTFQVLNYTDLRRQLDKNYDKPGNTPTQKS